MKEKTVRRKKVLSAEDLERKLRNKEMLRRFRAGELLWQLRLRGERRPIQQPAVG